MESSLPLKGFVVAGSDEKGPPGLLQISGSNEDRARFGSTGRPKGAPLCGFKGLGQSRISSCKAGEIGEPHDLSRFYLG